MKLYVIFNEYYGARVPLGFTTSKETAKEKIDACDGYWIWIEEYNISDTDNNYYEFPDWSM